MPPSNTARLRAFARLIALGYPPVLAAKAAGYRNLRASRAPTRLAPPPAAAKPERPRAPATTVTTAADDAPPPRWPQPPFAPMMTEEEWMLRYHPKYRDQARASA